MLESRISKLRRDSKLNRIRREAHKEEMIREEITKAFKSYDTDASGSLERDELRQFVDDLRSSLGMPKSDNEIFEKIFSTLDKKGQDKISQTQQLQERKEIYKSIKQ